MREFPGSLTLQYRGTLGSQAIGAHRKAAQQPQCVTATIPWREYALQMPIPGGTVTFNAGISLSLQKGLVTASIDTVKSVFVDNTAVDRPVFLQCADTGHVISVPDGFSGWYPLITFGQDFTLYTDNIIPLRDGNQKTRLIFSNVPFDTFGQPELNRAQALYRASGSANYVTPVIGDKLYSGSVEVKAASNFTPPTGTATLQILPALAASTRIVTSLTIKNLTVNSSPSYTTSHRISIRAGSVENTNELWSQTIDAGGPTIVDAINLNNLQVSLDGTVPLFVVDKATVVGGGPGTFYSNGSRLCALDLNLVYAEIVQPIFT